MNIKDYWAMAEESEQIAIFFGTTLAREVEQISFLSRSIFFNECHLSPLVYRKSWHYLMNQKFKIKRNLTKKKKNSSIGSGVVFFPSFVIDNFFDSFVKNSIHSQFIFHFKRIEYKRRNIEINKMKDKQFFSDECMNECTHESLGNTVSEKFVILTTRR